MVQGRAIRETSWGIDAREATRAWVALRAPDAPSLSKPVLVNGRALTVRGLLAHVVGIVLCAVLAGAVALPALDLPALLAGVFVFAAGVLGAVLGERVADQLEQSAARRWRKRHGHSVADVPVVIVSRYQHGGSIDLLVSHLDLLAEDPHLEPRQYRDARLLVIRAIHAERIGHRVDATRIAALSYLNSITTHP